MGMTGNVGRSCRMSSSEKVDRHNRYKDFNIISLPYPGCEFFNDWRSASYQMIGLHFDWDNVRLDVHQCVSVWPVIDWRVLLFQAEINSRLHLQLSFTPAMTSMIRWEDYKVWSWYIVALRCVCVCVRRRMHWRLGLGVVA